MATIRRLGFLVLKFSQFLSKIQIIAYFYVHVQNLVRIGQAIRGRVIVYFRFSKWRPSAILDLV